MQNTIELSAIYRLFNAKPFMYFFAENLYEKNYKILLTITTILYAGAVAVWKTHNGKNAEN
jgi:hypothetical protein